MDSEPRHADRIFLVSPMQNKGHAFFLVTDIGCIKIRKVSDAESDDFASEPAHVDFFDVFVVVVDNEYSFVV